MELPHELGLESASFLEKDNSDSSKSILAKGPIIRVVPKKDDILSLGQIKEHEFGATQCREKSRPVETIINSKVKHDFSDLQIITTKKDFEKFKEIKKPPIINVGLSSKSEEGKLQNQLNSQMKSECNTLGLNDAKQDNRDGQNCATNVCSSISLNLKEDSNVILPHPSENVEGSNNPIELMPKLRSAKGKKSNNAISTGHEKAKSVDSVLPHIKSKFNPESLQFINQAVKSIIFSGWIGEREYVDKIKGYRDVIEVDEWEETLNQKLKAIVNNISGVKELKKWINITAPCGSPCYRLWVLLDSAPFPGHYWFQIEDVIVENQFGLRVIVKILREIQPFDGENINEREKRIKGDVNISSEEWKNYLLTVSNLQFKDVLLSMLTVVTPSNLNNLFRLAVVLCVTLVVAFVKFFQQSWHFMLRFLRELGIFVHHATPFLQSVLNFIEKLIGGFYILLAMVYRDIRRPSPPPSFESHHLPIGPPQNHISYPVQRRTGPSVKYVPPQAWVYKND